MVKKSEEKHTEHKPVSSSAKGTTSSVETKLNFTLGLVILQLVVGIVILAVLLNGGQGGSNSGELNEISGKIDAMDTFFTNYVDGYNSPSGQVGSQPTGTQVQAGSGDPISVDGSDDPVIGSADAPVTIYEFSDFECPFCQRFYLETYGQLKKDYIDTGKVKLVFMDFPLSFHPLAEPAAAAANCVYNQAGDEKFFEIHDVIFENQGALSTTSLKTWVGELDGIDMAEWESCISDPATIEEINNDVLQGSIAGVSGTPSFVIGGELVVGAVPYAQIKAVIESKLN